MWSVRICLEIIPFASDHSRRSPYHRKQEKLENMKKLALAAFVVATGISAPCFAQNYFVDVGGGQGKASGEGVESGRKSVWAARIGARLSPNFAVDAGYEDLGKYDETPAGIGVSGSKVKASSWGVSLLAIAPLQQFDIYGRVGYARTKTSADITIPGEGTFGASDNRNEAFYGVGGRYNWANFGVFVEWNKHDKADVNYWLLGVQARF